MYKLTKQRIYPPTFTALVTRLVRQYAGIEIARELRFRDHNIELEPDDDQITPPPSLTDRSKDSSKAYEDDEKKEKKKSISHSLKRSCCKKFDCSKGSSDNYKVDRHNNDSFGLEVLKPVNTYFIEAMNFRKYRLTLYSQKHNSYISGKLAEWVRLNHCQIESSIFKPSVPISVLCLLHNLKTARNSSRIHEKTAMFLFLYLMKKNWPRPSPRIRISATEDNDARKEGTLSTHVYAVNCTIKICTADDVNEEAEADMLSYKYPRNTCPPLAVQRNTGKWY